MKVRAFTPDDKEAYLAMGKDFYNGEGTLFPITDEKLTDTFDRLLEGEPGLRGCILEQNGQAVGYALLVFYWSCEAGGKTVQLEELYLSEQVRGQGLGSQFMEWMLQEYEGQAKRFRLEVCPRNQRVKKLYERYGFVPLPYEQMVRE
ncbi:MAG TPA: GNAT family N-acetyltransferase [Candidatus Fimivicinus intestinavium]|nr:GNAT family N-acetyltransferase [Candidatus Fimivicinus intestinavium]